ncbi:DUF6773 family protein [Sediminibacillus albus]|uniref:Uncharacterized protein n=1 Tax=Sediminibacillus albus TaxID=407036 RepID=A0A1G8WX04_9BACI|nr:DUF6773 family protein [Sediminibacillus albus]SDJ82155.1 Protein of unknown function [Sediminibacillus albus]
MKSFFQRNKVKDERITNLQNKIYREIFLIVAAICVLSLIIKQLNHGYSEANIWTEAVILLVSSFYYMIRSTGLGIFSAEVELHNQASKRSMAFKNIVFGLLFGIGIGTFFGIRSAVLYADSTLQSIYYFLLVSLVSFIIYIPFLIVVVGITYLAAKKRSDRAVEKELEDDQDQDEHK